MKFIPYGHYEARFSPRDNSKYRLKDAARQHVGRLIQVIYVGVIEADRPLFAGEHEFLISGMEPNVTGLPVWFSELDLADIKEASK